LLRPAAPLLRRWCAAAAWCPRAANNQRIPPLGGGLSSCNSLQHNQQQDRSRLVRGLFVEALAKLVGWLSVRWFARSFVRALVRWFAHTGACMRSSVGWVVGWLVGLVGWVGWCVREFRSFVARSFVRSLALDLDLALHSCFRSRSHMAPSSSVKVHNIKLGTFQGLRQPGIVCASAPVHAERSRYSGQDRRQLVVKACRVGC
jgi:hypothetical protein